MIHFHLLLAFAIGQDFDAAKRVQDAAKKLADARATTTQLVAALEAAQAEVVKANKELDDATIAALKAQAGLRAGQLDAEQRAIDAIRALIQPNVKPIIPKMKDPPKKGIFDTDNGGGKSLASLAEIIAANEREMAKAKEIVEPVEKKPAPKKTVDQDALRPKGKPTDLGTVEKPDGSVVRWWSYSDRPKMLFLYSGELWLGVHDGALYRRVANGVVGEAAPAPVPLPSKQ